MVLHTRKNLTLPFHKCLVPISSLLNQLPHYTAELNAVDANMHHRTGVRSFGSIFTITPETKGRPVPPVGPTNALVLMSASNDNVRTYLYR